MMKKNKMLGVLVLTLTLVLTSCGNSGTQSPELVGTWAGNHNDFDRYTFYEDGTGVRGLPDSRETFRWSNPRAGRLTIRRDNAQLGEIRKEQWNYTISGNTIAFESRQQTGMIFSYTKVDAATGRPIMELPPIGHILIGTWFWEFNELYQTIFYEDGTGTRGQPDDRLTLQWTIPEAGHLDVRNERLTELWNYTVVDNILTLSSRRIPDMAYNFIRVE
jgi:hypothetical protein